MPKGVVLMYTGFTSCWQQHETLANIFASRGYVVLLPTSPGIGRDENKLAAGDKSPEYKLMPTAAKPYIKFVLQMKKITDLIKKTKLPIHVTGTSLGGVMGFYHFSKDPSIKAVLFTPFLGLTWKREIEFQIGRVLIKGEEIVQRLFQITHTVFNKKAGWGPTCLEERARHRSGVCDFQRKHFIATIEFSKYAVLSFRRAFRDQPDLSKKLLLVPVQGDQVVDSKDTVSLGNTYKASVWQIPSPIQENGQDYAVSHSVPSPYGVPRGVSDWYRCEVHYRAVAFFENGEIPPMDEKKNGILMSRPSRRWVPKNFDCMDSVTQYVFNAAAAPVSPK